MYVPKANASDLKTYGLGRKTVWMLYKIVGMMKDIEILWQRFNTVVLSWKNGVEEWFKRLKIEWKNVGIVFKNLDQEEMIMGFENTMRSGGNILICWKNRRYIENKELNNFGTARVIKTPGSFISMHQQGRRTITLQGLKMIMWTRRRMMKVFRALLYIILEAYLHRQHQMRGWRTWNWYNGDRWAKWEHDITSNVWRSKEAVFSMHPDKSSGPDGLNHGFFQSF